MKVAKHVLLTACAVALTACTTGNALSTGNNTAFILSPTTNEMYVFDLLTHRVQDKRPVGNTPNDIAVSGDSRRILVSNLNDGSISVFERLSSVDLIERGTINVQGRSPQGVIFNTQGTEAFVSVGDTSSIVILNTSRPTQIPNVIGSVRLSQGANAPLRPEPEQLVVTQDNQRLFVIDGANNRLLSFNRQQNSFVQGEVWQSPANAPVDLRGLTIDRTNRIYMTNSANDELIVLNGANIQTEVARVSLRDTQFPIITPLNLELNNAGTKLYITGSGGNVISVIPQPQALQGSLSIQAIGRNIAINTNTSRPSTNPVGVDTTSDDARVYVTNGGGGFNISLLNGQTDTPERNFGTAASAANAPPLGKIKIAFSPGASGFGVRSLNQPVLGFSSFFEHP